MRRKFYTLDVFTERALAGNPLAVVLDSDGLDAAQMQAIAREFNVAETVFVLPPQNPVNTARLRIFTPFTELPFAGHPTVGTAVLMAEIRAPALVAREDVRVVFEEQIGDVSCTVRSIKGKGLRASFDLPRLPEEGGAAPDAALLANALGLNASDIGFLNHRPSVWSAGNPHLFVPVSGLDAVARARPVFPEFHAAFAGGPALPMFVYTHQVKERGNAYHGRRFAAANGGPEDPATGSAVAAFAGVIQRFDDLNDGDHTLIIEQGFEMGRPSFITLGLDIADSKLVSGSIGGHAVMLMQGMIDI